MLKLSRIRLRRTDLQAKIFLVLTLVMVPTFTFVTVLENKLTRPLLETEMQQIGITAGKTLANDIVSRRLLMAKDPTSVIENHIQEVAYAQPNVVRIDVLIRDPKTKLARIIASNVEGADQTPPAQMELPDETTVQYAQDEDIGTGTWAISVPIEPHLRPPLRRIEGIVQVVVSNRLVSQIARTIWKTTGAAAIASLVLLIFILSYFLRKTIDNDRR